MSELCLDLDLPDCFLLTTAREASTVKVEVTPGNWAGKGC